MIRATRESNVCVLTLSPPATIDRPRPNKRLPTIEPVSDDLTIPINPRLSANRLMMISGALPRVAFNKRPQGRPEILGQGLGRVSHQTRQGARSPAPTRRTPAIGLNFSQSSAIATGMKTSSQFRLHVKTPHSLDEGQLEASAGLSKDRLCKIEDGLANHRINRLPRRATFCSVEQSGLHIVAVATPSGIIS